jgi:uncharacterized LabA/DUF88 family protein
MKTVIVIDGPYLTANLHSLKLRLDYQKLLGFLKKRYMPLLKVLFYAVTEPHNDGQTRFLSLLKSLGYDVHNHETVTVAGIKMAKGVDVAIAVDLMQWAEVCDRIVLVSGDSDFTPALLALPRRGVVPELIAFRPSVSQALARSVLEFIDLMELLPELVFSPGKGGTDVAITGAKALDPGEILINRAAWAGIRLEMALRKLCEAKGISVKPESGIDALNGSLMKAGVYDKLSHKRITVWAEIRNKAAHGLAPHYTVREVEEMESWVDSFIKSHGT